MILLLAIRHFYPNTASRCLFPLQIRQDGMVIHFQKSMSTMLYKQNLKSKEIQESKKNSYLSSMVTIGSFCLFFSSVTVKEANNFFLLSCFNRNYTIHPFPLPAHPSFRLVIALRLLLLPLDTTAGRQINGQKKQKINDVDLQIKTWEEMLMGHRDIVSTENEAAVQAALLQICKVIETQSKDKKAACLDVLSHLNVTQTKKIQAKSNLVINLLNEELKISLMMQSAISNGLTDW